MTDSAVAASEIDMQCTRQVEVAIAALHEAGSIVDQFFAI
jgi:hypothetical protein